MMVNLCKERKYDIVGLAFIEAIIAKFWLSFAENNS